MSSAATTRPLARSLREDYTADASPNSHTAPGEGSVAVSSAQSLESRFRAVRQTTTRLTAPLSTEDSAIQSMPDCSPTKWHLAHTTWFFETFVLQAFRPDYRPWHPKFGYLFNSYYNSVGAMHPRPSRGLLSRPSLAEVRRYREHIDERVSLLIDGGVSDRMQEIITLGLHHEQQHQELLLTDIKHAFSLNPLLPTYQARPAVAESRDLANSSAEARWLRGDTGPFDLGHPGDEFCFDNELPRHTVHLHPHEICDRPVTNSEYREFIADGGYDRPELWLSDGWAVIREQGWQRPLYWLDKNTSERGETDITVFTLRGEEVLGDNEPVTHLSYFEADAFARWRGCRLPTEAEWEALARQHLVQGNFAGNGVFHPQEFRPDQISPDQISPDQQPANKETSANGSVEPRQLYGDVWEWTSSPYSAYPGYRPPAGALGEYNGKFMANQMVIKGGSCVTPAEHMRPSYRNFFPPTARWQFTGLRLARDC